MQMPFKNLVFFLIVSVIWGCSDNPKPAADIEAREPSSPSSGKGIIRQAPEEMPDLGAVDGAFLSFWAPFQEAVEMEGRPLVMGMVELPLYGAGHLSLQGKTDALISDEFRYFYFRIINEAARQRIGSVRMQDIPYFDLDKKGYEGSYAEKLGILPGERVYYLEVPDPASSSGNGTTFYFAPIGGNYRLAWVEMDLPASGLN